MNEETGQKELKLFCISNQLPSPAKEKANLFFENMINVKYQQLQTGMLNNTPSIPYCRSLCHF